MQSATSQHVFLLLLVLQLQGMLLFALGSNLLQPESDLSLSEVCRAESKAELLENMQTLASETFREREEYTIDWMVKIPEGWEKADEIAERYGFINYGQASSSLLYASDSSCAYYLLCATYVCVSILLSSIGTIIIVIVPG